MNSLPESLISGKRVLQFNDDGGVDKARVAEHRVSPHGSLDTQALEEGRYDWIVAHHLVNAVEDDVGWLREMLRVAGTRGVVLLTVGGTSDRFETEVFPAAKGPYAAFRHYGGDFVARFHQHLPNANALEVVATDPCTATLDVVFMYSRDDEVLREIGRVMAPNNVYARLTLARSSSPQTASTSAVVGTPSVVRSKSPLPFGVVNGSGTQGARDDARWQPLVDELSEWRRLGRSPRFWIRDDDATRENGRLDALWQTCAANRVALACAAIPMSMDPSLIEWAKGKNWLVMLQHGYDHVNRAPAGASLSSEFPEERELGDALQAIRNGQELMTAFRSARLPVFVPPWGTIAPRVTASLGELGFRGVSVHYLRQAPRQDGIAVTNTHVLLPRLTQGGWTFEIESLVEQLVSALASVRARPEGDAREPIGVNTHHLSVGEAELLALDSLVHITRSFGAEWPHPSDLFEQAS
jgi:hypothetical protein